MSSINNDLIKNKHLTLIFGSYSNDKRLCRKMHTQIWLISELNCNSWKCVFVCFSIWPWNEIEMDIWFSKNEFKIHRSQWNTRVNTHTHTHARVTYVLCAFVCFFVSVQFDHNINWYLTSICFPFVSPKEKWKIQLCDDDEDNNATNVTNFRETVEIKMGLINRSQNLVAVIIIIIAVV